jgi:hypothetical protein
MAPAARPAPITAPHAPAGDTPATSRPGTGAPSTDPTPFVGPAGTMSPLDAAPVLSPASPLARSETPTSVSLPPIDRAPLHTPTAIFEAGADAGLLPFAPPAVQTSDLLPLSASPAAAAVAAAAVAAVAVATGAADIGMRSGASKPVPATPRERGGQGPQPPSGPPVSPGAAGVAGGIGGMSGGLWCAILLSFLAFSAPELRRHRTRLVLSAPTGVSFGLQRPG